MFELVILMLLAGLVIATLAGLAEAIATALRRPDRDDWRDLGKHR